MISDISYCRVPTDLSVFRTSHATFARGSCQKVFAHRVFSFCPRRSSNQWKKNTRPWVFHDFLSVSLFNFPPVFHFCWAAGPARRTAEKLWGGWDFTFKDGWGKHWTNWCIRVHISLIITRQLCHTLKTNFQEQTGSMTTMQEASCLIVGLSDCHCKRNSCFVFASFVWCWIKFCHVRLIHSVVKALEKEKSKNDEFEVRQKPSNRYCAFIWFQTFHIAEFPLIWVYCAHHMLRLLGAAAKKFLRIVFFPFVPEEAPINERRIRGHGFSMIFYRFPSSTFHQCSTSVGQQAQLEEQQKSFEADGILPSKMVEVSIEQTGASGCTSRLLHDSCATHWKPISRNKLEAWQQCKRRAVWLSDYRIVIANRIVVLFSRVLFDVGSSLPCSTDS